ncbi:MAG: sugar ABC transporter permease [Clostridia bacterium]|nr:sugar ABC transporter permease [Clostridia bacterium]
MTNDTNQLRQNGAGTGKKILAALGIVLLGCLIYLIIGGIFSGIGVPMWVSGVIAALIIIPLTAACVIKWDKLYAVYQSGNEKETLRLSKSEKSTYSLMSMVLGVPGFFKNLGLTIWNAVKSACAAVGREAKDIWTTFVNGDWKTKISYLVMGFGNLARGQILRGILFLLFEVVFIGYMILTGGYWLSMLPSLGLQGPTKEYDLILDVEVTAYHDNSFKILLYGVLTIFFIIAFIYTWRQNVKQNQIAEKILASGKKLRSGKDDLRSMVDDQFHKTLLALPLTGILIFTVLPIVFMILVAFTNYDGTHNGYTNNLFTWVGLDNFNTMLSWTAGKGGNTQSYAATFGEVLSWTLIWAFFATFTNYFLGMFVAMAINKKGIKFKKGWRTILVLTIAIPQFISLLYVSKMFAKNGLINQFLLGMGWIQKALPFWDDPTWARITVILLNIWIGIPYLMLVTTGILMNIPSDLYESARIDGANAWQQYQKITLPYMLFVTGPYLLTQFTGNMNNFNVIFLLTGGAPTNAAASSASGNVGYTDLLITWLFKITTGAESQYYLASVVGILVFVVVAVISLVVYNILPSIKNEEDFQ